MTVLVNILDHFEHEEMSQIDNEGQDRVREATLKKIIATVYEYEKQAKDV